MGRTGFCALLHQESLILEGGTSDWFEMKSRGVLLDLSGVVYQGNEPLPGAVEAIQRLQTARFPLLYLSNTTRKPHEAILHSLTDMGIAVRQEQLYTAPQAARTYMELHKRHPLLLLPPCLRAEFPPSPPDAECDSVLLGDAGSEFHYDSLNRALRILLRSSARLLLTMGENRYFRSGQDFNLDVGPFVRALEYAADLQAKVLGKPSAEFFHTACKALRLPPGQVGMIGDDVESDVLGAVQAGLYGILVRTGKYRPEDEQRLQRCPPRFSVVADLPAAVDQILESSH